MAIGKGSDFKIYDELVVGAMVERQVQNINAFNAASRGAIRLSQARHMGNYNYESFFKKVSLVSRRDVTSIAAAVDTPLTQGENISVKINRKIGPIAHTLDAFKKIGRPANEESISVALGNQVADDVTADMLNTSLIAGVTAVKSIAAMAIAATGANITTDNLVTLLSKFGDQASRVVIWVMHSKVYYNLVSAQIAANITGVSNFAVAEAAPVTLNRPVLITDSPALFVAGASPLLDTYITLGLVEGAVECEDSEEQTFVTQLISGIENLSYRYQGEYAFNLGVKGFTYDAASGGINPADATVGTAANWDKTATANKDLAGCALTTK